MQTGTEQIFCPTYRAKSEIQSCTDAASGKMPPHRGFLNRLTLRHICGTSRFLSLVLSS